MVTSYPYKIMGKVLEIFTDGGARGNPGRAASAFVVFLNGTMVAKGSKYLGVGTNNQAEYQGVISALEWLTGKSNRQDVVKVKFFLDSELVTKQLNKIYKVKNPSMQSFVKRVRELEKKVKKEIVYSQIPRSKNVEADRLVNQTLDDEAGRK